MRTGKKKSFPFFIFGLYSKVRFAVKALKKSIREDISSCFSATLQLMAVENKYIKMVTKL